MLARHRRGRRPLRAQPLIHLVPNIFTVMSLCAGLTAIRYGLDQRFELALALIVAAGVLDGLDGRSARLLNLTSKLGAQLDSLADFLSFGVAPALLVYLWALHEVPTVGWSLALLFATCCALRLARFNTELEDRQAAALDEPVLHRHAGARGGRLPHHADDRDLRPRSGLAAELGAERARHAGRRGADGEPGADLLDQDDRGAGQAVIGSCRP